MELVVAVSVAVYLTNGVAVVKLVDVPHDLHTFTSAKKYP